MIQEIKELNQLILPKNLQKELEAVEPLRGFYLFHSETYGSGKSTSAQLIADEASDLGALYVNCTDSDVNKKLKEIDQKLSSYDPIVVVDELDKLPVSKQLVIKNTCDKFFKSREALVIFTANNIKKINDVLLSPLNQLHFDLSEVEEEVINHVKEELELHNTPSSESESYIQAVQKRS